MSRFMQTKMTKFGALAIASALSAGALTHSFTSVAHAEPQTSEKAALAGVDELATAMKNVGKAVEPSVVSIEVEKKGVALTNGGLDEDLLKKFFPDNDGDGQPDVPPGMKFRFGPNGPNGPRGDGNIETPHQFGEGSGVILDATADKAYILTNNHVAGDAVKLVVTLSDGRKIEDVKVLGTDPRTDLAVLEIKGENLTAIKWGSSAKLEKGDIVLAFGAPFGYVGSMTQGIVSGLGRTTNPNGGRSILGQDGYENFIQTDCAINPGNSGGPLVNIHGEIVGINTAIASTTGSFNGIGFAIPSDFAKNIYEQLKETGKVTRGFLGVKIIDTIRLDKKQTDRLGLNGKTGVFVEGAQNDTPATGKLQPNDVIVSFNGEPVKTSQELRLRVAATKPGSDVKVGVIRGGKEQTVDLKLGTLPESPTQTAGAQSNQPAANTGEIGATLSNANANRLKAAGIPADAKGALVTAVKEGSIAQQAGLEVGDLITKVNDTDVTNGDEAAKAIKEAKLADGISLMVVNREGTKSVFVQSGE